MTAARRAVLGYALVSALGAGLVTLPAQRYRIDRVRCDDWPSALANMPVWLAFVAGVLLLALAWWRLGARGRLDDTLATKWVLALGALPHLVALTAPPFLSEDPLAYAAFGHAIASFHQDPHRALDLILPATDPFFLHVQPAWRDSASAYSPGFNALAALVARVGGEDLALQLRLYQLLGFVAMLATAALAALASERQPARAAALVLFCPLAVLEGTLSAHNDALLAVTVAAAALCSVRGRRGWAAVALATGLAVKDSAILLLAFYLLSMGFTLAQWQSRSRRTRVVIAAGTVVLGAALAYALVPWLSPSTIQLFRFDPQKIPVCVRSVECLPRVVAYWVLQLPRVAFAINVVMRLVAGAWLLYAAARAARDGQWLRWAATFVFVYYLYLHAFLQAWYLLSLLPLLPFAPRALERPMRVFAISLGVYYAVDIPLGCLDRRLVWQWALTHVIEGIIVIVPATVALVRARRESAPA